MASITGAAALSGSAAVSVTAGASTNVTGSAALHGAASMSATATGTVGPIGWVERIHDTLRSLVDNVVAAYGAGAGNSETYTYGALYEPPAGTIIQGLGQDNSPTGNDAYLATLGGLNVPAIRSADVSIGPDTAHPPPTSTEWFDMWAGWDAAGMIPSIGISMDDESTGSQLDVTAGVAAGTYDAHIDVIATAIVQYDRPMFIRVGFECNVGVYQDQTNYKHAYRHVVNRIRSAGATKCCFVWGVEASASPGHDFTTYYNGWYPGDDVVDWCSIDVFDAAHYLTPHQQKYGTILSFCDYADAKARPVMLGEVNASGPDMPNGGTIPPNPALGQAAWDHWFVPFFALPAVRPGIKAFAYVTEDFTGGPFDSGLGWKDARLDINETVRELYVAQIAQTAYIDSTQRNRLNGYSSSVALVNPIPTQFDNEPEAPPADLAPWVRVTIQHEETLLRSSGGTNVFRRTGTVTIEVRTPSESGDAVGLALADALVAGLRGVTSDDVTLRSPTFGPPQQERAYWRIDVTVPWFSDWSETHPAQVSGGPAPTLVEMTAVLRERLSAAFGADIALQFDNAPAMLNGAVVIPDVGSDPWVRLSILPGQQMNVAGGAQSYYRAPGLAVASIFVPVDTGDEVALALVDQLETTFRGLSDSGMVMGPPFVSVIGRPGSTGDTGPAGAWWQVNVKVPFMAGAPV